MTQKPLFLFSNILGYLSILSIFNLDSGFMLVLFYLSAVSGFLLGVLALSKEPYFHLAEDRALLGGAGIGFIWTWILSMGLGRFFCGWENDNFLYFFLGNLVAMAIFTFLIVRSCWVTKSCKENNPTPTYPTAPKTAEKYWNCKCGRQNSVNTLTCFCGTKLRDMEIITKIEPQKSCKYCGKSIDGNSSFCRYCGKSTIVSADEVTPADSADHGSRPSVSKEKLPLILTALCHISLGVFLILNIKMAPFHGTAKVLAYIAEAILAIYLTILAKRKLSCSPSPRVIRTVIAVSLTVIIVSVGLRIVYNSKVEMAEKDMPQSGTILVEISENTAYYATQHFIKRPHTTVEINGSEDRAELTLGEPIELVIQCSGTNIGRDHIRETITIDADDFKNGSISFVKTVSISSYTTANVTVTLRRYCTFWSVIFH